MEIWRKSGRRELTATLGEFPADKEAASKPTATPQAPNRLGITVSELPAAQRKALGIDFGLIVERIESSAAASQLRRGDVIISVNQARIGSLQEFNELLTKLPKGSYVALQVRRGPATIFVPMQVN